MIGCLALAANATVAPDPTRLSLGCRVLGLGKAFIGMADDTSAVYTNPAGLSQLHTWQMNSFSGNFLDEFSYLSLTGAYPTTFGNFGLGFAGSSVGGAPVTKIKEGTEADPVFEVDPTQPPVSYFNNVFVVGYSFQDQRAPDMAQAVLDRFPILKKVSYGTSLKLFSAGLAGDALTDASASGMDMDLGILYRHNPWFQVGIAAQNVLPASMGGKLRYSNGHEETYPAILEIGTSTKLLGKKDALRSFPHDVTLVLDYDIQPTRAGYPNLMHAGLEWVPHPIIAIRAGIDQDMSSDGSGNVTTANNLCGGVGLTYGGFRFDYAFHQFDFAPGVDNHFFALTYGLFPPRPEIKDPIVSIPDKHITFESSVLVEGAAVHYDIVEVRVNEEPAKLDPKGGFTATVPLDVGKNVILVRGYDRQGKQVAEDRLRILRLITYPDVPANYWTYEQVGYIGTMGIIKGYPDGTFRPEGDITRAEMSTLLVRTQSGGDENVSAATSVLFPDVPLSHWAAKYVNMSLRSNIVKGYPDGTFRPKNNITRAEGLTMIARFSSVSEEAYADEFVDVNADHWAAMTIAGADKAGMLTYLAGKPFEPNRKLTRSESVELLYRAPYVQDLIKNDLLNWETY